MEVSVNVERIKSRYQLRYAAGGYWLLDMEQDGAMYRPPLSVNGVGADIWKGLLEGWNFEQIIKELSLEYGVSKEEIGPDVQQFYEQLAIHGVL